MMAAVRDGEGENGRKKLRGIWRQYAVTFTVNLGAFSIGTLLGWTSQVVPKLKSTDSAFDISDEEISWIAGLMPLGAAFAAFPVPIIIRYLGRKWTLLAVVPFYVLGFALLASAENAGMYYAGRFITGMSGGTFSIISPLYTAEIGEKNIRGSLGTYYELMLAVGVEFSYVIGGLVSVFWLSVIIGLVPLVFAAIFVFIPESPYYLVSKGKWKEASKSLEFFRAEGHNIAGELDEIGKFVSESEEKKFSLGLLGSKPAIKSILIAFGLMVFQQFGGANAVVFNTTAIFQEAGSNLEPSKATMIVGFMQFGGNFLSMILIDKLGRRFLLLVSGLVMGTCTLVLGFYFRWLNDNQVVDNLKWIPLLCLSFFMVMFAVGWGPVAWMMLGELFPTEIKSVGSSFSCATNWIATFLVTKYFGDLVYNFGQDVTFWIFTTISVVGVVFVYFCVPETRGKSLEEIQRELQGLEAKGFTP